MPIKLTGDKEIQRRMSRIAQGSLPAFGQAMKEEYTEVELPEVQRRTPVDTGALVDTEEVRGPFFQGTRVSVEIIAGGTAAPYAIYVHEDLEAIHPRGQAKFIESVVRESSSHIMQRIGERVKLKKLAE